MSFFAEAQFISCQQIIPTLVSKLCKLTVPGYCFVLAIFKGSYCSALEAANLVEIQRN